MPDSSELWSVGLKYKMFLLLSILNVKLLEISMKRVD